MTRQQRAIYGGTARCVNLMSDLSYALRSAREPMEEEETGIAPFKKERLRFRLVEGCNRCLFHSRIKSRYGAAKQIDLRYRAITERDQPKGGK